MDLVFNGTRISLALQLQHQKCSKKKFSVIKIFKGIIMKALLRCKDIKQLKNKA